MHIDLYSNCITSFSVKKFLNYTMLGKGFIFIYYNAKLNLWNRKEIS